LTSKRKGAILVLQKVKESTNSTFSERTICLESNGVIHIALTLTDTSKVFLSIVRKWLALVEAIDGGKVVVFGFITCISTFSGSAMSMTYKISFN